MSTEYRMYGNWRRPRSTGMAGATFGTTMIGIGGAIICVLASLFIGFFGAAILALVMAAFLAPMMMQRDGRSGYERWGLGRQWRKVVKRGEDIYSSGTFSRIPGGRYRPPGVLADTELYEGIDSNNRPFGMIHMPQTSCYTVNLDAHPQGSENFDQDVLDQAVGNWSQLLTAMGETSDIVAIVAIVETLPNTGIELYETVSQKVRADAPKLARDSMYQLSTGLTTGGLRLGARIAITFEAQTADRKKDPSEQAVEIGRRLPQITAAAARAGVPATPMSADEMMGTTRRSVDPASLATIERALYSGESTGLEWADCGPRTQIEQKDRLVHDGAVSVTWEMREAPKSAIHENVLKRLLDVNPAFPIKRVAIVYRPHSAAEATDIVNRDHRDATAALNNGRGIATAKAKLEADATDRSRMEVARGHGLVRFGILITVTQPAGTADVPRVDALVRDLSIQSQLQIRRSFCWQSAAFWTSLGVGVIPPEHTSIPSWLSN